MGYAVFRHMIGCTLCKLSATRQNVVVGRGPLTAKILIIGEAPGENEDIQGRPFVGKAGHKLTEMMAAAGIEKTDVYITNIVKCRPPSNRQPTSLEVKRCRGHLELQMQVIQPRVLVTLGNTSLQYFFPHLKITSCHGQMQTTRKGHRVIPIIHPAATFRNPEYEQLIIKDLKKVRRLVLDSRSSSDANLLIGNRRILK